MSVNLFSSARRLHPPLLNLHQVWFRQNSTSGTEWLVNSWHIKLMPATTKPKGSGIGNVFSNLMEQLGNPVEFELPDGFNKWKPTPYTFIKRNWSITDLSGTIICPCFSIDNMVPVTRCAKLPTKLAEQELKLDTAAIF